MIKSLSGYKTYILCAFGIVVIGLYHFNFIPADVANQLLVLLGFGTTITLRQAVTKVIPIEEGAGGGIV